MNSDEAAELARLRELAYGPDTRIDAASLARLRELEGRSAGEDAEGGETEANVTAVETLPSPDVDEAAAPPAPHTRPRRRVSAIAAVGIGLAIVVAGLAGFAIGSQMGNAGTADPSAGPSATETLVPGSPSADVQCGQLDALIGVLVTAKFELDIGVNDEQFYAAQVRGVENVLKLLPLGYTDVSSAILLVQRAAARELDPADEAFITAVDGAAQACAEEGANLTWALVG